MKRNFSKSINPLINKISYSLTQQTKFIDYKTQAPNNMFISQRSLEFSGDDHYLMKIKAIGINRAELLHRLGRYLIKNDEQKYLGLEAAGQLYDPFTKKKIFDGIALLSGGSYAQWAKVSKNQIMKLPTNFNFAQGAAIPEAWLTAFQILHLAQVKKNDNVVVYASASGVGTATLQICRKVLECNPYSVVSNKQKADFCEKYGACGSVLYKDNQNWANELLDQLNRKQKTQKKQFDAVLDCICKENIQNTIKLLDTDGRWVLYGTMSGIKSEINFGQILHKRIKIISTTLKSRSNSYKTNLIQQFSKSVLPKFETRQITPVIDQILKCNWDDAQSFNKAHQIMGNNLNSGKIIIQFNQ